MALSVVRQRIVVERLRNSVSGDSANPLTLHQRAVHGDRLAIDELATRLLPVLRRRLRHAFPVAEDDQRADAAADALLEYAARPGRFDPCRGIPLEAYLFHASSRNLLNRLDSERRRSTREAQYASYLVFQTHEPGEDEREPRPDLRQKLSSVVANERETQTLLLWLDGERRTESLGHALGLSHLPLDQQRREVKRFKDRLLKRFLRLFRRAGSH